MPFFLHGVSKPIEKSQNDAPKQLDHQFLLGGGQTKFRLKPKKTHIFLGGFLLAHQPKPSWNFVVVHQTPRELITGGTHDPPNDHRKGAHLYIQLIHAIQMVATSTVLRMLDPGGVKIKMEGTIGGPLSVTMGPQNLHF